MVLDAVLPPDFFELVVAQPEVGEFTLESFMLYAENNDIEVLRQLRLELEILAGGEHYGQSRRKQCRCVPFDCVCR